MHRHVSQAPDSGAISVKVSPLIVAWPLELLPACHIRTRTGLAKSADHEPDHNTGQQPTSLADTRQPRLLGAPDQETAASQNAHAEYVIKFAGAAADQQGSSAGLENR